MSRRRLLLVTLAVGLVMPASAVAAPGVGHRVERLDVPGAAANELRKVDVHVWYPADVTGQPKTVYTSALHGKPLPNGWAPLSWTVDAQLAHEAAPLAGGPYAPIVFSHGANNDPIDYAHTLEEIAAAGFVVLAPTHTNNTQDDVRRRLPQRPRAARGCSRARTGCRPAPLPTLNANGFPSADCAKGSVPEQHVRSRPRRRRGARRGPRLVRRTPCPPISGRDGPLARHRHGARRRRREPTWGHRCSVLPTRG